MTSDEGRAIGAAVSAAANKTGPSSEPAEEVSLHTITAADEFDPADDPLIPEEPASEQPPRRTAATLRAVGQDDRDMIIVEDEQRSRPAAITRPRRQEYRQLFSKLRGK